MLTNDVNNWTNLLWMTFLKSIVSTNNANRYEIWEAMKKTDSSILKHNAQASWMFSNQLLFSPHFNFAALHSNC